MSRSLFAFGAALLLAVPRPALAQNRGAAALGEAVASLGIGARVLVIGAHPDDEDTQLITWLTRGRHVETAYLSLTRGDGGQNLIGNELGEALGAIRTEELLAARRVDGAQQYFTRAYDFGFSKTADEAFSHWPHDSVLADVVTIVRAFRPQVIVSVFSGTPRDGHGQHQVAGIVAREAFDAAADSVRFPRTRSAGYGPWTTSKFYRGSFFERAASSLCFNVGEYSPLLGESYAEIAAESRSQHKSQGFGRLQPKGARRDCVKREVSRVPAPEANAEHSIFDGLDTTVYAIRPLLAAADQPRLDSLRAAITEVRRTVSLTDPTGIVAPLGRAAALTAELLPKGSPRRATAAQLQIGDAMRLTAERLDRALQLATGVAVEATIPREVIALGDSVPVTVTVYDRSGKPMLVHRIAEEGESIGDGSASPEATIAPDSAGTFTISARATDRTSPWWLDTPRAGDMYTTPVDGRSAESHHSAEVQVALQSGGARFTVTTPIVYRFGDPVLGELHRPLAAAPAITVTLDRTLELAPANTPLARPLRATVRNAATTTRSVTLTPELPAGLAADSASRTLSIPAGEQRTVSFDLTGKLPAGSYQLGLPATSNGERYASGYVTIDYPHIRPIRLYRDAALQVNAVDVKLAPGLTVAYIPGVGDNVAPMLQQLGVKVTVLDPAQLPSVDLSRFSTVVVGPRAYQSSDALVANSSRLLDYVRDGGTMVVQYGQYEMTQPGIMPYPITIARPHDRVTDENAPVTVLLPEQPVLNTPNDVGPADFQGWVQERSLYMPRTFDEHYVAPLSMHDPGEPPNQGALLIAPYGKGTYIYTTMAFFRELPAGNAGAARLFANLLSTAASTVHP